MRQPLVEAQFPKPFTQNVLPMNTSEAKQKLVSIIKPLAVQEQATLDRLKQEQTGLERPDFLWHYLLQSFSTMGRAAGSRGLIENKVNYNRVTFESLSILSPADREAQVRDVCRAAKIRMPDRKAEFINRCFAYVQELGGPTAAKEKLLALPGRAAKLTFLQTFPGIGPKYARNIMMDVYHEDFRDSIAIDIRIKAISTALGLTFSSYEDHEQFYLDVAAEAGLNGWELDRLLFNFRDDVERQLLAMGFNHTNAIRISLNGEVKATAPLWPHMMCSITSGTHADGTHREAALRLGGMDETHFLDWLTLRELPIGTSIQIDLLEFAVPDVPSRRLADPLRDEKREREDFELAKNEYLKLKDKYEPDTGK